MGAGVDRVVQELGLYLAGDGETLDLSPKGDEWTGFNRLPLGGCVENSYGGEVWGSLK